MDAIIAGMTPGQDEQTVSGRQAAIAQTALRKALGLPPEQFCIQAFVGMISDEIEQLRLKGKTDQQIAALVAESVAVDLSSAQILRASGNQRSSRMTSTPAIMLP